MGYGILRPQKRVELRRICGGDGQAMTWDLARYATSIPVSRSKSGREFIAGLGSAAASPAVPRAQQGTAGLAATSRAT